MISSSVMTKTAVNQLCPVSVLSASSHFIGLPPDATILQRRKRASRYGPIQRSGNRDENRLMQLAPLLRWRGMRPHGHQSVAGARQGHFKGGDMGTPDTNPTKHVDCCDFLLRGASVGVLLVRSREK